MKISPEMQFALDEVDKGNSIKPIKDLTRDSINKNICTSCCKPVDASKYKPIDKREYLISGFCKKCQDIIFTPPPDDDEVIQ